MDGGTPNSPDAPSQRSRNLLSPATTFMRVGDPNLSTSAASDVVDLERRLPFPPMRQVVDPEKHLKLRAFTLQPGQFGGPGSSSVGKGSRSHHSSTSGGVRPYLSVTVAGVNLGSLTSISTPMMVDPSTGQPTISVGSRTPVEVRGGMRSPTHVHPSGAFDKDCTSEGGHKDPVSSSDLDSQLPSYTDHIERRKGQEEGAAASCGALSSASRDGPNSKRKKGTAKRITTTTTIGNSITGSSEKGRIDSPKLFPAAIMSDGISTGTLEGEVFKMLCTDLVPSFSELQQRHQLVHAVMSHYREALQFVIPGRFELKYAIFGSVQTRTCLPDGDVDVAVFVYPLRDCVFNKPLDDALNNGNVQVFGADVMTRAKDFLARVPSIGVDSLIFAEVRVLKLVYNGVSVDLTAGQIGGYTTAAFIAEADRAIGHVHRFRYALLLIKAWCLHDAHIVGGSSGYLTTYAISTILLAVFNRLLRDNTPVKDMSPLRMLLHFLRYCAEFDFEGNVLTLYGPVPLENVNSFVENLPSAASDSKSPVCQSLVGYNLIQRCLRKYSGSAASDLPLPHTPRGSSTPPAAGGQTFPIRPMNIMDPLRPYNNLSRGVSVAHMNRLVTVFRHGYRMLLTLIERHTKSPMDFIVSFFPGIIKSLQQLPPSEGSIPATAMRCKRCPTPTVFCTDLAEMERHAAEVTCPSRDPSRSTIFGYEALQQFMRSHPQEGAGFVSAPLAHLSPAAFSVAPPHRYGGNHHVMHTTYGSSDNSVPSVNGSLPASPSPAAALPQRGMQVGLSTSNNTQYPVEGGSTYCANGTATPSTHHQAVASRRPARHSKHLSVPPKRRDGDE